MKLKISLFIPLMGHKYSIYRSKPSKHRKIFIIPILTANFESIKQQSKMRIGIEAQRLLRPNKHGMDIVALELIRALQRIDQLNEYYIFVRPDVDRKCLNPSHNVHIVEIECPNYALWEQYYLPKFARKYKLDILHCTANTAPLFCNVPVVVTLHDVIFMEKMPKKSTSTTYQRLGNLYRKYIVPAAVKRAEHVVTVSHYEKKQIINTLPIPESKISVVHNGVGHSFKQVPILPQVQLVKHRYELPESYFFYLGNTDPKKNLLNVIKAFSLFAQKVENVFLVIADLSQHVIENQLKKIGCLSLIIAKLFGKYLKMQLQVKPIILVVIMNKKILILL